MLIIKTLYYQSRKEGFNIVGSASCPIFNISSTNVRQVTYLVEYVVDLADQSPPEPCLGFRGRLLTVQTCHTCHVGEDLLNELLEVNMRSIFLFKISDDLKSRKNRIYISPMVHHCLQVWDLDRYRYYAKNLSHCFLTGTRTRDMKAIEMPNTWNSFRTWKWVLFPVQIQCEKFCIKSYNPLFWVPKTASVNKRFQQCIPALCHTC